MKHFRILVSGRVQGVGFRYHAKQTALKFNISGYVSNQVDGSVLIEAEGKDLNIKYFVEWCQKGPDWARVDTTSVSEYPLSNFKGFSIR